MEEERVRGIVCAEVEVRVLKSGVNSSLGGNFASVRTAVFLHGMHDIALCMKGSRSSPSTDNVGHTDIVQMGQCGYRYDALKICEAKKLVQRHL